MTRLLTRRRCLAAVLLYLLFALAVLAVAPFIGSEPLRLSRIIAGLRVASEWTTDADIFFFQRIPRVLLGFCVGGALALVGAVFQVVLRNPLAEPYTLGVTGGGTLGAVVAISLPPLALHLGPFSTVQLFALVGSFFILALIYALARRPQGLSMSTLLLAGVTLASCRPPPSPWSATSPAPTCWWRMDHWIMGGLYVVGYRELAALFPLLLPGLGLLLMQMVRLNHLALGEELALGHGVDVAAVQRLAFFAAGWPPPGRSRSPAPSALSACSSPTLSAASAATTTALSSPPPSSPAAPSSSPATTLARTLVAPTEMPVGIITALIGGPFFIRLLLKKR